jgi:hypothetical protein
MDEVSKSLQQYWFPDGARLHIEAEVMDQASGRKETSFDWSIVFALRPFKITVKDTRFYFKPGLSHDLIVSLFRNFCKRLTTS